MADSTSPYTTHTHTHRGREPIELKMRLVLTAYFSLMGASSLLVMLLAMSFNVGIILAILVGEVCAIYI